LTNLIYSGYFNELNKRTFRRKEFFP
jgi:hypothetical protein